ncbi:Xaa-Pro aminopeptidase [Candidatus Scalindua japonica]|uniref:Xaa-Pro aminopeptidase n=1 Tax=Candidatus Scalindua japonica TaxID=1284222 RepID=A0A286U2X8_9BACT|nr:Xaa-Pro peptidase family protein [Candidatus Scalindua japonica]GAX62477.1 Xaa-Pro aminopeptidase [Candidatus Scalindua japonica]
MSNNKAILIVADSERDSNMYYATGFSAPDTFAFIQRSSERFIITSDLELDRAKSQSKADTVLSFSKYERIAKKRNGKATGLIDIVAVALKEMKIIKLQVPANFSIEYADFLRKDGFKLEVKKDPFFDSREVKNDEEKGDIVATLRNTEKALEKAIDCVRKSIVKDGFLFSSRNRQITSESIRNIINVELMKKGCTAKHTIVSCGEQSCEPHNVGHGPLRANESIIFDVFPKDEKTGYYADISRTIVKGKASRRLKKMYKAVASAQELVFKSAGNGISGDTIHRKVMKHLTSLGFKTGKAKGKMQGFFHGTGHGVGLDVHEPPRISKVKCTLQTGNIVTVEPGLYYPGIGGVRLEDMILITDDGCRNLTKSPKVLEV